jgi:hypothetical protein
MESAPTKMNPQSYRPFEVVLVVTRRISYLVEARTSEEAEDIAEEWLVDGEEGIPQGEPEIEVEDVSPVDELSSDEVFRSDPTGFHT